MDGQNAFPPELYEQLRAIARVRMSGERKDHTLQPTALVHEAVIRLSADRAAGGMSRPEFLCAAAESMRRILIDHARAHRTAKRGGGQVRVSLEGLADPDSTIDILALEEAISRLQNIAPEATAVVRLRFYAGLTVDESAEALGISPRSVDRHWSYAKAWLWRALSDLSGPPPEID